MITDAKILDLASRVAPFVRVNADFSGRITARDVQDALRRIGVIASPSIVHRVENAVTNYWV